MALPTAYMTSRKRLPDIFDAIKTAKAPEIFTQKFLETLEFKSKGDRLIINVFKALGFLDDTGKPIQRYYEYLDQTHSDKVLAQGIREAYSDLFAVHTKANELQKPELLGKLKTLSQGSYSDAVLNHMADTFLALVKQADFKELLRKPLKTGPNKGKVDEIKPIEKVDSEAGLSLGGLVYSIQIVLPETRDQGVYDALFKSLRQHLK